MFSMSYQQAAFRATREEWETAAKRLEDVGEKRLAKAIRNGLERKRWYNHSPYDILLFRFSGGSIQKLVKLGDQINEDTLSELRKKYHPDFVKLPPETP